MESVKVKRLEVLEIIKANREKHKKDYLVAIKAYRVKVVDLLSKELEKAKTGKDFSLSIDASKPHSYLKDYDLAIKMLEMSVYEIIELKLGEFNQLVNDQWSWQSSFKMSYVSNSAYFGFTGTQGSSGSQGTQGSEYEWDIVFPEEELDIE